MNSVIESAMTGIGGSFFLGSPPYPISADMAGFSAIIRYHGTTCGRYGGILALRHGPPPAIDNSANECSTVSIGENFEVNEACMHVKDMKSGINSFG